VCFGGHLLHPIWKLIKPILQLPGPQGANVTRFYSPAASNFGSEMVELDSAKSADPDASCSLAATAVTNDINQHSLNVLTACLK